MVMILPFLHYATDGGRYQSEKINSVRKVSSDQEGINLRMALILNFRTSNSTEQC